MVPERVRDGISSSQRLLNRPIIKLIPPHFSSSTLVLISPPKRTQIVAKTERARGLKSSGCKDILGRGRGSSLYTHECAHRCSFSIGFRRIL